MSSGTMVVACLELIQKNVVLIMPIASSSSRSLSKSIVSALESPNSREPSFFSALVRFWVLGGEERGGAEEIAKAGGGDDDTRRALGGTNERCQLSIIGSIEAREDGRKRERVEGDGEDKTMMFVYELSTLIIHSGLFLFDLPHRALEPRICLSVPPMLSSPPP
jgi:hypothetical protein